MSQIPIMEEVGVWTEVPRRRRFSLRGARKAAWRRRHLSWVLNEE